MKGRIEGFSSFQSITAVVDINKGKDSSQQIFADLIHSLGAKVEAHVKKTVNLVVWKNGNLDSLRQAEKNGVQVVNTLWVNESMK